VVLVVMGEMEIQEPLVMAELEMLQTQELVEMPVELVVKVLAVEGEVPVWQLLLLVVLVVLVELVVLLEIREGMDRSVPEQHTQGLSQLLEEREVLVPLQVVLVEVLQVIDLLRPHSKLVLLPLAVVVEEQDLEVLEVLPFQLLMHLQATLYHLQIQAVLEMLMLETREVLQIQTLHLVL
jgi:hypothetical protein